jgi:hypothetical protein
MSGMNNAVIASRVEHRVRLTGVASLAHSTAAALNLRLHCFLYLVPPASGRAGLSKQQTPAK